MLEKLISKIKEYNPQGDIGQVIKAYKYAEKAHEGQLRRSGEEYFIHPFNVAMILADLHMDVATISAGLLHDVLEDTDVTFEVLADEFSEEIANLVDGVTKLKKLKFRTKEENQVENLRKMIIAMSKDIRVIIIKLADRLHNARTLDYMPEAKRKEKALETLEIYAPIAHRLGISKIKWELEDIALRYIDPEGYYELVEKVSKKRKEREAYINNLIKVLKDKLDEMEITSEISGRPKHFYSIYRKMVYQNKNFEQIFDLTAIRVIVDNVKDCYGVLGIVHTLWKPIPGRFKDYIAVPKPNMYQSLHTTVIGPRGEPFEIQIRTFEMHKIAEYGIAAHWKYKEGVDKSTDFENKLSWLRQLLEWQKDLKDPKEFMESLKIDFFNDEVFVFTPKGDVINLPAGSTPIDFAYRVHTAVGNNCVGAKVDGRIVPIDFKIKNGNIIEILTSPNSAGPSRDWLKLVKSSQAKAKIKQWFKKEERDQNLNKGKELLEKEVKRQGFKLTEILKEDWLKQISKKLSFNNIDDLYAALGYGSITLSQVTTRLKEFYREYYDIKTEPKEEISHHVNEKKSRTPNQGVSIKGIDNIKVRFSRCCSPVPGDDIVGYVTRGRGVSVHRRDCPNIAELNINERFIDVEWASDKKTSYNAEIQIKATDRTGLLTEITQLLTDAKLSVNSLNARTSKERIIIINMTLEIKDVEQLTNLMRKIKALSGVIDVYRVIT
ncbi:GTP pyrophosphokinase RelA [Gottschalkia purinilytica]|uniref:GTP diphosphokinase n=1 Tax=Gottschalkia purinilytica TaxID=1503 RepID=A0A0L0WAZ7_GOTPU|nr:bifunctional (p)ppGpp synthetase/guanosine-3',5'-bis(diphosphate) 3'-pyrophosphohydrolase [Gottschalkia purinilytica]KNF08699.1 GTP pyrophosphokinase RelA [Gottschalkia purinilytica]